MPYRLYRRDQIEKGKWYYTAPCKGCGKTIYLLDDLSEGKSPSKITGDGEIGAACHRCGCENVFPATSLKVMQSEENLEGGRPPRVTPSKSSRKQLWKAYPKAKATFGVGYIEDRPAAAAIVARIITAWADIEVECARLLAELMQVQVPPAAAVFGSLRSSRAQYDALNAAAIISLSKDDLELFEAHMTRRSSLEKERNDLAHGCFGVSVQIPDHIVWVPQYEYLIFSTTKGNLEEFRKKQFVYELGTLERIAQEIEEFYHQLGFFRGYLYARRDGAAGAAFRAQRYSQLCNQSHIRQALDRRQTAKKDGKSPR